MDNTLGTMKGKIWTIAIFRAFAARRFTKPAVTSAAKVMFLRWLLFPTLPHSPAFRILHHNTICIFAHSTHRNQTSMEKFYADTERAIVLSLQEMAASSLNAPTNADDQRERHGAATNTKSYSHTLIRGKSIIRKFASCYREEKDTNKKKHVLSSNGADDSDADGSGPDGFEGTSNDPIEIYEDAQGANSNNHPT